MLELQRLGGGRVKVTECQVWLDQGVKPGLGSHWGGR